MPLLPENVAALGRIGGPLLSSNLVRTGAFADPADSNLAFETDLLYLDVVNGRIGVKTSGPSELLNIQGSFHANNFLAGTTLNAANLRFTTDTIQNFTNSIYFTPNQLSNPKITANKIATDNLLISDKVIQNTVTDDDIHLATNAGNVIFNTSKLDILGNGSPGTLHATGDITWDGDIIFGSDSNDNVSFAADVKSDILPNTDIHNYLGGPSIKWKDLLSQSTVSTSLSANSITGNVADLLHTFGKIYFVTQNGFDTNTGTLESSAFRTVKHALSVAQTGDEIIVFPGTYTEEFPLTVPQGVHVRGAGIRSVIIQPTAGTNDKDAFLLNGETTVSFLTVANYYYNSTNNTGYGFRFADGILTTRRSPYVQYVTTITQGSVTTVDDPRGFDAGDAGRGALVDAAVCDPNCIEPAMLFNAVTFIAPNAIGLFLTNGARVEWLNCFTYFADKGIYLTRGASGVAGLGLVFNTEVRSIGSANIYGNYGAVADGLGTLGYLIGHNFAYIGTGKDSNNDRGLVIQANEVLAINDGELFYDSMDHKGDYRVGDVFYVNQETGAVTFNAQALDFTAGGSISIEGIGGQSYVDAFQVLNNNIKIHDNNIDSLLGPVDLLSASGITYLNTNVNVTGGVYITGDTTVKGNVFLGNQPIDTVNIVPKITQTLFPKVTGTYDLGSDPALGGKAWNNTWVNLLNIDDVIKVDNNTVTTLTTNTNLELKAPVKAALPMIYATPDYTIAQLTSSGKVIIAAFPAITLSSDFYTNFWNGIQPGDTIVIQTSDLVDRTFTVKAVGDYAPNPGYYIDVYNGVVPNDGFISQMYRIPQPDSIAVQDNLDIVNNLSVTGFSKYSNLNLTGNLTQTGSTYRVGTYNETGNANITGNLTVSGTVDFQNVQFDANIINSKTTNSDLILDSNGTGIVSVPTSNVNIANNLEVIDTGYLASADVTNTTTANIFRIAGGGVQIDDNFITTNVTNQNLLLKANGTGKVEVLSNNVSIVNDLTVNGTTNLKNTEITGALGITGDVNQTGNINRTGNTSVTGSYTVSADAAFTNVNIVGDRLFTTVGNTNLEFRADGTGIVKVLTNDVTIDNNLTVGQTGYFNAVNVTNTTTADAFDISDVYINDNYITTLQTDQNLLLKANNNGIVRITKSADITQNLAVNDTSYIHDLDITGNTSQTGNVVQTGNVDRYGDVSISTTVTVPDITTVVDLGNVQIVDTTITTTQTNADLILEAGVGKVINVPSDNVLFDKNLNIPTGTAYLNALQVNTTVSADYFDISDVYINDNYITTLQTDQDLLLKANGTGKVEALINSVDISQDLTVVGNVTVETNTYLKNTGVTGNILHTGAFNQTGNTHVTGTFGNHNIELNGASSYVSIPNLKIQDTSITSTATDADLILSPSGTGLINVNDWLTISQSTITNIKVGASTNEQKSIKFSPNGTGNTVVNSTTALALPVGSELTRTLTANGEIRFNSAVSLFEGFNAGALQSFYALYDADRNTYITPELTQGANDNTIRFVINNSLQATLDTSKLRHNNLLVDNVSISGAQIKNNVSSTDLSILTPGTGVINVNNVLVKDNTITNQDANALTFVNSGNGYVKFGGKTGVVMPYGDSASRPANPELGEVRQNTEVGYMEVWDGTAWTPAVGGAANATLNEITDIVDLWTLILG